MSVKAKYIKDLPLKNELDGSESLLVQDLNGTQQAPLGTIIDEIKQNSQEKIREIESDLAQTNARLSAKIQEVANKGTTTEVLQATTKKYIDEKIADGTVANLTIKDNSITGNKIKDRAISHEKVSFIQDDNVKNICDYSKYKDNSLLNNVGSIEDNGSYFTFIFKVEPNTPYSFSVLGNELLVVSKVVQKEHYFLDDFSFISNHINVDKIVTSENCQYLAMSLHKPSVELSYGNFEDFKNNKFFVQKGETPTPVTQPKLVGISVEYLESEIENLKNSNFEAKANLFTNHSIKENMILNHVGWVEDSVSSFTTQNGIKVSGNTWYSFSYENFPIQASAVSFKTADDIDANNQSTHIQRVFNPVCVKSPANAEYMFISFPNKCKENLSEIKVAESVSALELSTKTPLFDKTVMTLGDSLTELGIWQNYVAGKLGIREIRNLGVGGTTVNQFTENVTHENLSDVDFVIMMGFFNSNSLGCIAGDISDESSNNPYASITAQYKFNIEKLLTLKPKLRIVIMSPHRPRPNDCSDKVEAVRNVAKYYGLPFIDIYNEGGFNSLTYSEYLMDDVHSTHYKDGGYHKEAELITAKLISYFG